jgi:hypothetical protein
MTNEIQKVREEIARGLALAEVPPVESVVEVSPCGQYQIEIEEFGGRNGMDFAVAVVRHTDSGREIATIKRNDSRCFYSWASRAGGDYLILPEDLEGSGAQTQHFEYEAAMENSMFSRWMVSCDDERKATYFSAMTLSNTQSKHIRAHLPSNSFQRTPVGAAEQPR